MNASDRSLGQAHATLHCPDASHGTRHVSAQLQGLLTTSLKAKLSPGTAPPKLSSPPRGTAHTQQLLNMGTKGPVLLPQFPANWKSSPDLSHCGLYCNYMSCGSSNLAALPGLLPSVCLETPLSRQPLHAQLHLEQISKEIQPETEALPHCLFMTDYSSHCAAPVHALAYANALVLQLLGILAADRSQLSLTGTCPESQGTGSSQGGHLQPVTGYRETQTHFLGLPGPAMASIGSATLLPSAVCTPLANTCLLQHTPTHLYHAIKQLQNPPPGAQLDIAMVFIFRDFSILCSNLPIWGRHFTLYLRYQHPTLQCLE